MSYTPPAGNNVNFFFKGGYIPPAGNNVDFNFGIVAVITIDSISTNNIFDSTLYGGAFDESVVRWKSSAAGAYRIELGGNGANTGSLVKSGNTLADFSIRTDILDSDIKAATTFSGSGSYQFNIYVKSVDDVWTPYEQS